MLLNGVCDCLDCCCFHLQEIIASFSFQAKVNLSAIKRIYSSLLWHFEQVGRSSSSNDKQRCSSFGGADDNICSLQDGQLRDLHYRPAANSATLLRLCSPT